MNIRQENITNQKVSLMQYKQNPRGRRMVMKSISTIRVSRMETSPLINFPLHKTQKLRYSKDILKLELEQYYTELWSLLKHCKIDRAVNSNETNL